MRGFVARAAEPIRALTGSKVVESRLLNVAGVQVWRAVAARAIHQARGRRPRGCEEAVASLEREGYAMIPDLLPTEAFVQARAEALEALANETALRRVHDHGGAVVEHLRLSEVRDRYPVLKLIAEHPVILDLLSGAERRPVRPWSGLVAVERVTFQPADRHDAESDLHTDIFFNSHKAWYYLDDVEPEDGPFVFVPRSHRLSVGRLRRIYDESVTTNRGSRRIAADELAAHGEAERAFTCRANTLLSANTSGFHRRSRGVAGHTRLAVIFNCRANPFFPHWLQADRWLSRQNPVVRRFFANA